MAKEKPGAPAEAVVLYEKVVATIPSVERKGAAIPYTAVNGNMFSMLSKSGDVALRLPEPARGAFLKKYKTKLQEEYGIVREEYVIVPPALLAKTSELAKHFAASHAYALSLRAKPTTRKKASKKK